MLDPKGRVVMVSGANRGIGLAIARSLHDKGYTLSLGARDQAALERATAGFDAGRVLRCAYDAAKPPTNEAWVAATVDRFGRIDAVVNNAGIAPLVKIEDADESKLDQLWAINVKAPLRMIRLALPHLRRSGSGRVVNVASLSGKRVKNENVGYAMSKFALVAMTHALRLIGWSDGVRATALCPGFVATDLTAGVTRVARHDMIDPADLAELAAAVIALPNNSVVAELLVNCQLEEML
ncbi:MAG: SDR family NAD(P)-dependent oxidoreductase [Alphaproteobacteria bacterium]|nr:SDR family NAD(P)-dependent oxidoreductase [Alphaproteobacteria bacterium]